MSIQSIILALSLAANAALGWAYLHQRDATTTAKVEQREATGAAQACSDGTDALAKQAAQRQAAAAPKIAAAASAARAADRQADLVLSTPASVPGDDCRSAVERVNSWWKGRAK